MHYFLLTVAGLLALAVATPDQAVKRQNANPTLSSVFAQISSLGAQLLPPASLVSELAGIPASVTSALFNPTLQSSLASEFESNGPPSWFTSLAPEAKSYILGIPAVEATILPQIISIEQAAGLSTLVLPSAPVQTSASTTASVSSATIVGGNATTTSASTGFSNSTVTAGTNSSISLTTLASTSKSTSSVSRVGGSAASTQASSSTSKAGAAQATGAIAAGFVGAVGFLGLAIAL